MSTYKAERTNIKLADTNIDTFMLPNGEFGYSQTSAANALEKDESDTRKYLAKKALETGQGEGLTPATLVKVGRTRIRVLTDIEVASYWQWKAENGNVKAKALMAALAVEALHRRATVAFGIQVTEEQHEERTVEVKNLIERALECQQVIYNFGVGSPEYETALAEQRILINDMTKEEVKEYVAAKKAGGLPKYVQEVNQRISRL